MPMSIAYYIDIYNISQYDSNLIYGVIANITNSYNNTEAVKLLSEMLLNSKLYPKADISTRVGIINLVAKHNIPIEEVYENSLKYIIDNNMCLQTLLKISRIIASQSLSQELNEDYIQLDLNGIMEYLNSWLINNYKKLEEESPSEWKKTYKAASNTLFMHHNLLLYKPLELELEFKSQSIVSIHIK